MKVSERQMANAIRALSMDAVQAANSGHPGMPMGMADVATILFKEFLKYDSDAPKWIDRDRFVLSAGHGSMLIYSLLHLTGYAKPTMEDIRNFRQINSPCAGHPENFELEGVETTTGPLGQGLATAVGMAIAERHLSKVHGNDVIDHRTWVVAGDGCLMEGINHEAIGLAGHLRLGRLNVLWDDNRITIDGNTDLSTNEDVKARYVATGWHVVSCDGHDFADIRKAMEEAVSDPRPSLIACKTVIGFGSPNKQGTSATHGAPLGEDEIKAARKELGWDSEAFVIPEDIAKEWKKLGKKGKEEHKKWQKRFDSNINKSSIESSMTTQYEAPETLQPYLEKLIAEKPKVATRKASEMALEVFTKAIPQMIGGSADLTGSNNTKTPSTKPLNKDNYNGRYINYGIREFGMAAAMNGMALHGGIIPYAGTFLVFADYCRAAIRLSALQRQRVIYVMTHDSIGLGEDGPTHQPVEHVQSLRIMPNLNVYRPADAVETAECWELALRDETTPSVLSLTRQGLPTVRDDVSSNMSANGAYRLKSAKKERKVIIVATGSEVAVALEVASNLEEKDIGCDVISMPCAELFDAQDSAYQNDILPDDALIVSIEAGSTIGWERYTGRNGLRFGIDSFGASAPASDLFDHFGLTSDKITPEIIKSLA